jgi:hypothetical protein
MRWWWGPLCAKPTCLVGFLVLAHWNNSPVDMPNQIQIVNYLLDHDVAMFSICSNTKYEHFSNKENWYDILLNFDMNFNFFLLLLTAVVMSHVCWCLELADNVHS